MRTFLTFVAGLATAAILAALVILALENRQGEQVTFLGATAMGTAGLDIAAGAALGFVAALLVLLPGQAASAVRAATLGRKLKALEGQLAPLRAEKAALAVGHARLQEEHRCLRDEMTRTRGEGSAAVAAAPSPRALRLAAKEPADDRDVRLACAGSPVVLSRCACAASRAALAAEGVAPSVAAVTGTSDRAPEREDEQVAATAERGGERGDVPAAPRTWWARVQAHFGGEASVEGEREEGERAVPPSRVASGVTVTPWRRVGGSWQA